MATEKLMTNNFNIILRRVEVPMFELQSNPTIQMSVLKSRNSVSLLKYRCSICDVYVSDINHHASEYDDDLHKTMIVVDA
jgi:hypothetical protein